MNYLKHPSVFELEHLCNSTGVQKFINKTVKHQPYVDLVQKEIKTLLENEHRKNCLPAGYGPGHLCWPCIVHYKAEHLILRPHGAFL
jgi:hypothetical protein